MSKSVRFADQGVIKDYAESVATDILQERQKRKFESSKAGKGKGKKRRRSSTVQHMAGKNGAKIAGFNKGLLSEFIIFLLLQGFDLISNIWVLSESVGVQSRAKTYEVYTNVTSLNCSVPDKKKPWLTSLTACLCSQRHSIPDGMNCRCQFQTHQNELFGERFLLCYVSWANFECFHGHSARNAGFEKVREV